MGKSKSTFELSSLNPLHKKYSNSKSSTRSRKGSIFSLSSDVVPQTLDVNHKDTTNPLIQSVSASRKVKNRNRSDTSTTLLSNVGFQSIGYNRPSEDYSQKNPADVSRNSRVSVDRHSNAEAKHGTSQSTTPGLYLTSTNISSRRNADLRNSHILSPISSTRRSFSSSRSSLQRSRSQSSDFDLFLEPTVPHETSSSSSPNLGKKHHFYSKFLPRRKSLSKNSAAHHHSNEENAVSSISKILHYPHYNTKHGHGATNSSLFENSASKRQVSTHVLQDLITQNETLTKNDVVYLHDLIKNMPTLEQNFHQFSNEERERILQNTWHVYCNICFALFKNHRIWNLNNKIEDLNRVLQFYIKMVQYNVKKRKHTSKSFASSSDQSRSSGLSSFAEESETSSFGNHPKHLNNLSKSSSALISTMNSINKEVISIFLDNLEAFFLSALYVLENQIVFNYKDESVINNPVRRMCIIWKAFYENIFNDVLILNNPFDTYFDQHYNYTSGNSQHASSKNTGRSTDISVENIVLRCFRDSIVLPYYQNFSHANEGGSASFMKFINEQEDIKTKEKLLVLQCFGVLKTIGSKDHNQLIIDELSTGLRMSMS